MAEALSKRSPAKIFGRAASGISKSGLSQSRCEVTGFIMMGRHEKAEDLIEFLRLEMLCECRYVVVWVCWVGGDALS